MTALGPRPGVPARLRKLVEFDGNQSWLIWRPRRKLYRYVEIAWIMVEIAWIMPQSVLIEACQPIQDRGLQPVLVAFRLHPVGFRQSPQHTTSKVNG
jgi:hypothetical protein